MQFWGRLFILRLKNVTILRQFGLVNLCLAAEGEKAADA